MPLFNSFKEEELPEIAKKYDVPLHKLQEIFRAVHAKPVTDFSISITNSEKKKRRKPFYKL